MLPFKCQTSRLNLQMSTHLLKESWPIQQTLIRSEVWSLSLSSIYGYREIISPYGWPIVSPFTHIPFPVKELDIPLNPKVGCNQSSKVVYIHASMTHFFCDYSFWGLFNECNKLSPFRTLIKWQFLTNGLDIMGLLSMVLRERES